MKKMLLFFLIVLSGITHAQLSNIDFGKSNTPANSSNSGLLKCDIFYDFLEKGSFDFGKQYGFCYEPVPHKSITVKTYGSNKKETSHNIPYLYGKTYDYYFRIGVVYNTDRDGMIYTYLDQCVFDFPNGVNMIKSITKRSWLYDAAKYRTFDEAEFQDLVNFFATIYPNTELEKCAAILSFETEKNLRDATTAKVLRIKPQDMKAESIFLDYLTIPDKNGLIWLNVFASDGKKIATYSTHLATLVDQKLIFTWDDGKQKVTQDPIVVPDMLHVAVENLTQQFLSDAPTIAKINNQKEAMQNTYHNDQERLEKLMYELQFYQKERANR